MALDFMERVFAARTPKIAKAACYYAAVISLVIGLCASIFGLASYTLVKDVADPRMVLPTMATSSLPYWLGVLVFIGILGASMSTANGALLVMSIVLAQNIVQRWSTKKLDDSSMLTLSRTFALPTALFAGIMAYVRPEPGILLVIAFDIVFAGCVAPLFFGIYWKKTTSAGAIAAIAVGTISRTIFHFAMPAQWSGADTLIPPVLSVVALMVVSLQTQEERRPVD